MTDEIYDEVEVSNVSGGGYRVECRGRRAATVYRGEWVTVNGDALTTDTTATIGGRIRAEYVPGAGDEPSGVKLTV